MTGRKDNMLLEPLNDTDSHISSGAAMETAEVNVMYET